MSRARHWPGYWGSSAGCCAPAGRCWWAFMPAADQVVVHHYGGLTPLMLKAGALAQIEYARLPVAAARVRRLATDQPSVAHITMQMRHQPRWCLAPGGRDGPASVI